MAGSNVSSLDPWCKYVSEAGFGGETCSVSSQNRAATIGAWGEALLIISVANQG